MKKNILLIMILCFLFSCSEKKDKALPFLGFPKEVNGQKSPHTVPDWEYYNTDSTIVSNKDLSNHIYLSNFFFRSCPTICPKVKRQMKLIYDEFKDNPEVKFVSFTLDPKRDTPEKLKEYAANLNVNTDKWWFLSGDADETYELTSGYLQIGYADDDAPGGFDHSGKIILTDKEGHIRSFSEGTYPDQTPRLIKDVKNLLAEYAQK